MHQHLIKDTQKASGEIEIGYRTIFERMRLAEANSIQHTCLTHSLPFEKA